MKAVYKILNNKDKVSMKHFYHIRCDPELGKVFCAMRWIPCSCTGCVEQLSKPWLPNLGKPNNHVMLLNQKHVSTLQSYGDIIDGIFAKLDLKKETTNPNEMKIKDALVLQCMNQAAADDIEYNTMGASQTSDKNTHGYYIVKWTGNAYTLQEKYTCHAFNPPVIIPEGELVCPSKFMAPMKITSHWYHKTNEAIPVMVKLKQIVIPLIELIQ